MGRLVLHLGVWSRKGADTWILNKDFQQLKYYLEKNALMSNAKFLIKRVNRQSCRLFLKAFDYWGEIAHLKHHHYDCLDWVGFVAAVLVQVCSVLSACRSWIIPTSLLHLQTFQPLGCTAAWIWLSWPSPWNPSASTKYIFPVKSQQAFLDNSKP